MPVPPGSLSRCPLTAHTAPLAREPPFSGHTPAREALPWFHSRSGWVLLWLNPHLCLVPTPPQPCSASCSPQLVPPTGHMPESPRHRLCFLRTLSRQGQGCCRLGHSWRWPVSGEDQCEPLRVPWGQLPGQGPLASGGPTVLDNTHVLGPSSDPSGPDICASFEPHWPLRPHSLQAYLHLGGWGGGL